ncbi:hypothetical protein CL176_07820 [Suicoccus acidiformans]|uniref:Lipopolysaccharide assembly protein A domain-containing protein n=1 Tax=Suicoccus acidiformans TaxID=2036206 RepID=A0A347WLF4_9LACT|nr:LapA family protein [Suicoccus acidiformans]AXY25911.1 hypothetical protein CL176_07820 [Suicoccus acidiformans]
MKEQWKVILMIIILIVVVIFSLQNTNSVAIDFFVRTVEIPLVLVILFSVLVGVIVGLVTSVASIQGYRKDAKGFEREANQLRGELTEMQIKKDKEISELKAQVREQDYQADHTATLLDYEEITDDSIESESAMASDTAPQAADTVDGETEVEAEVVEVIDADEADDAVVVVEATNDETSEDDKDEQDEVIQL